MTTEKRKKRTPGRPSRYPFFTLDVGCYAELDGDHDYLKAARMSMLKKAAAEGFTYRTEIKNGTLKVWRPE
ncbi:hypothetical protein D3C80_1612130 [compost metagenome]